MVCHELGQMVGTWQQLWWGRERERERERELRLRGEKIMNLYFGLKSVNLAQNDYILMLIFNNQVKTLTFSFFYYLFI